MSPNSLTVELFRNLFDVAPDPILIVGSDGLIVLTNRETAHQFGYTSEELIGQRIEILMPERFRSRHTGYRTNYGKEPSIRPMGMGRELFAMRKDGSEFPVEISLSPMNVNGEQLVIGIIRNITERKKAEFDLKRANTELERSNKELEEFAYIASHDLQEPLRSITGACQLLRRRNSDKLDAPSLEFIDFAVAGAKRMEELINDLLIYSRVSTKAREPKPANLNHVLTNVLDNIRSAVDESSATVTFDDLPTLPVDSWQVSQLFQNLIANSLKFRTASPPRVHISAQLSGDFWQFSVKDNGIGIDPKYFDRIFVVFKRLHNRDQYSGTGIGLASCKKIVERHGGEIWIESALGQGSTFYFTLPAISKGPLYGAS